MRNPTVRRKDITLDESREEIFWPQFHAPETDRVYWTATLYGALSTGEDVSMSRTAEHAGEALLLLTEAIEAEGWLIDG